MKLDIEINKYLLMWHLLYESSVSEELHKLKQELWKNYKKEYSDIYKEKEIILKDIDNYIPNDDFMFNILESSSLYKKIRLETNKYRLSLLEVWDSNSKLYKKEIEKVLRCNFNTTYNVCVLHPGLDVIESYRQYSILAIGKKITTRDKDSFLTFLIYKIIKGEFTKIKTNEKDIVNAVVEFAITNELYTRVTKESKYNLGSSSLKELKLKIYPYWLMYLGVKPEKMEKYMVRDNMFFNISNYKYDANLVNYDIYTFINYLIKNRRFIARKKTVTASNIEIL